MDTTKGMVSNKAMRTHTRIRPDMEEMVRQAVQRSHTTARTNKLTNSIPMIDLPNTMETTSTKIASKHSLHMDSRATLHLATTNRIKRQL